MLCSSFFVPLLLVLAICIRMRTCVAVDLAHLHVHRLGHASTHEHEHDHDHDLATASSNGPCKAKCGDLLKKVTQMAAKRQAQDERKDDKTKKSPIDIQLEREAEQERTRDRLEWEWFLTDNNIKIKKDYKSKGADKNIPQLSKGTKLLIQLQQQIAIGSTQLQHGQLEVDLDLSMYATPETAPIVNLAVTREEARTGLTNPPPNDPPLLLPKYALHPVLRRVEEVGFFVALNQVGYGAGAVGPSDNYCDAVFNHRGYPGSPLLRHRWRIKGESRTRHHSIYERGHIIAHELGGHDSDPLNFFPQHQSSNAHNSAWWRIERIAAAVADAFSNLGPVQVPPPASAPATPAGAAGAFTVIGGPNVGQNWPECPVAVYITFNYPPAGPGANEFMPTGGSYEIRVPTECYDELVNAVILGQPSNDYLDAFLNAGGRPAPSTQPQPAAATRFPRPEGHVLSTPWINNFDRCAPAFPGGAWAPAPAPPLALDAANGFHACPQLYP